MRGFCPLASGSKGNCLFLGTKNTRILIDAGISERTTREKLNSLGIDPREIDALLITHEHSDHIKGAALLSSRYKIPIFANSETAKALCDIFGTSLKFKIFSTGEPFEFGDIEIHPFSIQHDTLDPVAFTFFFDNLKLGVCTDLGFATSLVKNHLSKCSYLYIEANHEPSMVHASSRPATYKERVLSRQGHLSNAECADLISHIAHGDLKQIYLAHLSEECNAPEVALNIVKNRLPSAYTDVKISIAFQHRVSEPILF